MTDHDIFVADCPARTTLGVIADTWTVVLVTSLLDGPQRHTELRDRVGGISAKVLTQTLRRLEGNGLVARRRLPTAPPGVEYELTSLGRTLEIPIRALARWAEDNSDELLASRDDRL